MRNLSSLQKTGAILYTQTKSDIIVKSANNVYENGYVEGLLSTFDNVDTEGDVIRKGAWTKTINERVSKGLVPLMSRHFALGGGSSDVIGSIKEASETNEGLFIRAPFSSDKTSQEIREKVAGGHLNHFSAGFRVIKYKTKSKHESGVEVNEFLECGLLEGTITPIPANESAIITGVKTLKDLTDNLKSGEDNKIDEILSRINGLISLIEKSYKEEEKMITSNSDDIQKEPSSISVADLILMEKTIKEGNLLLSVAKKI